MMTGNALMYVMCDEQAIAGEHNCRCGIVLRNERINAHVLDDYMGRKNFHSLLWYVGDKASIRGHANSASSTFTKQQRGERDPRGVNIYKGILQL